MPLLKCHFPDRPAFRVLEVERETTASTDPAPKGEAITDRIGTAARV
jgi:hypothetical protein